MLTLDTTKLNAIVTRAKADAAQHPRWITAIDRAAELLVNNPYVEALDDHTLLIGSESGKVYTSNGTCSCEAFAHGKPCRHRAAARLYTRYLEAQVARPSYEVAVAELLECF